jgi:anti-sigma factor ChrR (cupin superfamily)
MSARDDDGARERLPAELAGALATGLSVAGAVRERATALRERVLARVRRDAERAPRDVKTVRSAEGEWVELLPGLFEKVLYVDLETGTRSFLVRAERGAVVPAHVHDGAEECLVIEGDVQIGNVDLRAGDYHVAPRGTTHPFLTTRGGCIVFLREPVRPRDHA